MNQPRFRKDDWVLLRSTNAEGRICDEPIREAGEYWYSVRTGRKTEHIVEEDLDALPNPDESLQSLAEAGKWGQLDAVRCALAIERIEHTNRSTIYAFQNQRILFQAYQYKPLLKLLDSPDRRLLIADEVGLGKTIEAGLILTELNARKSLESVMIVCPSRLREKWKNELNRKFDEDFEIFDKKRFEEAARLFNERPGKSRVRGIMSTQAMRGPKVRAVLTSQLAALDLVIFDEAHHARNTGTSTSQLLRDLCEVSDSVILLTATPVQLNNSDLFTLLSALRPTEFRDRYGFERLLARHADLHIASGLAKTQQEQNLPTIVGLLEKVFVLDRRADSVDPLARQLIEQLQAMPPATRGDWIGLERRIQDLHPLGTILTRTKKRDVLEDAPMRVARSYRCGWTRAEDEAYRRLTETSGNHGWPTLKLNFGQIQRARQAASCLPAAYETRIFGKTDDDSTELCDILPSEITYSGKPDDGGPSIIMGRWDGPDSKFAKFNEILDSVWTEEPGAKLLVFTFFKGTARYLERRLTEKGIEALRIDGDVPSDPHQPDKDERGKRIERFKDDPKVKVLVSTEVGSEGLDFQFCHHLVNYDLPWNPMVVEQRIGRIDRFGQNSKKVFIHNLVVEGTVEDTILERLYNRIGIFERSIGALEAILGDTMTELQRDYLNAAMTPEEAKRRVDQAANAIEQRNKSLEELEQKASQLFGNEEYVRAELARVRNLGQFVGESAILAILRTYFRTSHPEVKIKDEGNGQFAIKLTDRLVMAIHDAARKQATIWRDRSRQGILRFTTSGETAFKESSLELIGSNHPMVRAAIDLLHSQMEPPAARLGAAWLIVNGSDADAFPEGDFYVVLVPQTVMGIRSRRLIETIAISADGESLISSDAAQRLLYLTIENGKDWVGGGGNHLPVSAWDKMMSEIRRRTSQLRDREKGENEALYVRRRNALEAEHAYDLQLKTKRLQTAKANKNERIVPAFEGQIEKAQSRFREELKKLDQQQTISVSSGEPIAICLIHIVHAK
jgi:superfamily II DNA or RNA helicase